MTLRDKLVARMAIPRVVVAAEAIEAANGDLDAILNALDALEEKAYDAGWDACGECSSED